MARITLVGSLSQVTGGVAEFDLPVASVKQLFRELTERYPEIERHLADGIAVAIDGQIFQDALLEPIGPDSEVFLLPQIGGGAPISLRPAGGRRGRTSQASGTASSATT